EEARRVAKAGETQQRGKNEGGYQGRKGQQQAPKTFGQNRIPANRYSGHEKWRGGIFVDSAGVKRFKVPPGTCFACFKEGHRRAKCEIKGNRQATAKSRAEELRKDNILVPLEDANALSVADLLEPDRATLTALAARLDALPLQNQAFRTLLPPSARPSPPAALPDPSSPPSGFFSVIDDDVQTLPRFFRVTDCDHDEGALLSSSVPDLFAHRSNH
ncbi:hypothetical protein JCM11641_003498, partial [Rhodosporidiobolus odoratus]